MNAIVIVCTAAVILAAAAFLALELLRRTPQDWIPRNPCPP